MVSGVLAFIFSWNKLIFAVVLARPRLQSLPVSVFNVMSFAQINWAPLAAAALMITAPVLLHTPAVRRHIVASRRRGVSRDGDGEASMPGSVVALSQDIH